MESETATAAARLVWDAWSQHSLMDGLPEACRPSTADEGYAVQRAIVALSGAAHVGWKIAATSKAGQAHIGVDGPLAGRLLDRKLHESGATLSTGHLHMKVAEIEFAFRFAEDLPARGADYSVSEVLAAVGTLHPAIEIPDSRFTDFTVVGEAQLIADNGCTEFFVCGAPSPEIWRETDLVSHTPHLSINGAVAAEGRGANVLGDPREALTWLANDRARRGEPLRAGQIVTTGTCIIPAEIKPGDVLDADFGTLGRVGAALVD